MIFFYTTMALIFMLLGALLVGRYKEENRAELKMMFTPKPKEISKMTVVTYFDTGDEFSINIEGHAGYDIEGSDIVCAAISMLGQTLLAYLDTDNDEFRFLLKEGRIGANAKGKNVRTALNVFMA